MAKRVFFSFHYQDVSDFRANVVRNHWLLKSDRSTSGFFDASIWETAKKTSSILPFADFSSVNNFHLFSFLNFNYQKLILSNFYCQQNSCNLRLADF